MDLNFMDKVSLFMKLNFSSFLTIEEALIFILIFLFLLFNLKYKNKIVSIFIDRKSTRLNSSHTDSSRMPSSA